LPARGAWLGETGFEMFHVEHLPRSFVGLFDCSTWNIVRMPLTAQAAAAPIIALPVIRLDLARGRPARQKLRSDTPNCARLFHFSRISRQSCGGSRSRWQASFLLQLAGGNTRGSYSLSTAFANSPQLDALAQDSRSLYSHYPWERSWES
jgi:hypothetical protein